MAQPLLEFPFLTQGAGTGDHMIKSSLVPPQVTAWFQVCLTKPVLRSLCPELSANLPLPVCVGLCHHAMLEVSAKAVYWLHLKTPWGVLKILLWAAIWTGMAMRHKSNRDKQNRTKCNHIVMKSHGTVWRNFWKSGMLFKPICIYAHLYTYLHTYICIRTHMYNFRRFLWSSSIPTIGHVPG